MKIISKLVNIVALSKVEKIVYSLLIVTFFIGIWHAFPMFNVIGDEMYYVGGVFRAIQNHTIFPAAGDVPYGTLTYIVNYILTIVYIIILLPFFKFHVLDLKIFLVKYPTIIYLSRRFLSAIFAVVMLFILDKLFKKEISDQKTRIFLIILFFTNMITTLILHTGKMWVLSFLLVLVSFYYLHDVIKGIANNENSNKSIFLSIVFAFLALSNFPLNFYTLINIPILIYYYKNDKESIISIFKYTFIGFVVFLLITLFNFEGIKAQIISIFTTYHPLSKNITSNLNFIESFRVYFLKILVLYPLSLITLFITFREKIKNKKLFTIASIYFFTYFFIVTVIANWSVDIKVDLRYLFPLGFFIVMIISSFDIKFRKVFYVLVGISIIFQLFLLYYLSVPTTYNRAYDWIRSNLAGQNVLIINKVAELQLIKNSGSSLVTKQESCATKCKNTINFDLNSDFKPFVVDLQSEDINLDLNDIDTYYILENPLNNDPQLKLINSFSNNSKFYHSVEYNIGSYFDPTLFTIKNFGKNIYIYKRIRTGSI